jgi:hypothetical protein
MQGSGGGGGGVIRGGHVKGMVGGEGGGKGETGVIQ